MDPLEPDLTIADVSVPVREVGPAGTQRLHLGTGEHEAGLEGVLYVVIMARAPVLRDGLAPLFAWH